MFSITRDFTCLFCHVRSVTLGLCTPQEATINHRRSSGAVVLHVCPIMVPTSGYDFGRGRKRQEEPQKRAMLGRPGNNVKVGIVGVPNVGKSRCVHSI